MKKVMSLVAAMLLVCATISAQNAKVETIEFNKKNVQGVSLPLPGYSVEVVKGALEQRLEKGVGLKGSNSKGWRTYLAQQFLEIGSMNFDIYTMVNTIGKKKDATTVVYVLVSKGNENFANLGKNFLEFPLANNDFLHFATKMAYCVKNLLEKSAFCTKL